MPTAHGLVGGSAVHVTDPTPIDTPYGTLYVDPEELVIGRLLQENGKIPDISEEVAFFRKYLKPGDTAIDVGANYGLFTLALADIVSPGKSITGRVIAYEPNEEMYRFWDETHGWDDPRNITWMVSAVGKVEDWGTIRLDPRGSGGTQFVLVDDIENADTHVTTLDTNVIPEDRPIKAIKIDAEGMDVDVLLGAETILKEDRPAVIFEWNPEAMESLGKKPLGEMAQLVNLSYEVQYRWTNLQGVYPPEQMLGNLAFLPDELLD